MSDTDVQTDNPTSVEDSISVNPGGNVDDGNQEPSFLDTIPDSFKEKPYMKGIDSMDKLLSKLDGAQSLIGKKGDIAVPSESATEEEVNQFYAKLGRPEGPDKYELHRPEGYKETEITKLYDDGLKKLLFENGISSKQATNLSKGFDELVAGIQEKLGEKTSATDEDFEKQAETLFKDRKEQVIDVATKLIEKHAPEALKDYSESIVENVDNKALLLFSAVLDSIAKTYISPDELPGNLEGGTTDTLADLERELKEIPSKPEWKNFQHPQHEALKKRFSELGTRIAKLRLARAQASQ